MTYPRESVPPTLREVYPTLSEADLKTAEENLDRYLQLAWRIYERTISGSPADPQASVDGETLGSVR